MTEDEASAIIDQHLNEAVELFGFPVIERLEVGFIVVGRRDRKIVTMWSKTVGFKAATSKAITQMALLLQETWLHIQIEQQKKAREKPSEGNDPQKQE